ncbi:unnamed protein product [Urochloa humidicola]
MPDSADGSMQHDSSRQFPAWPVCLQTPRGLPLSPKKTQSPKKPVQAPAVANSGSPSPQTRGLPESSPTLAVAADASHRPQGCPLAGDCHVMFGERKPSGKELLIDPRRRTYIFLLQRLRSI